MHRVLTEFVISVLKSLVVKETEQKKKWVLAR